MWFFEKLMTGCAINPRNGRPPVTADGGSAEIDY
jgi:hypothetical protein